MPFILTSLFNLRGRISTASPDRMMLIEPLLSSSCSSTAEEEGVDKSQDDNTPQLQNLIDDYFKTCGPQSMKELINTYEDKLKDAERFRDEANQSKEEYERSNWEDKKSLEKTGMKLRSYIECLEDGVFAEDISGKMMEYREIINQLHFAVTKKFPPSRSIKKRVWKALRRKRLNPEKKLQQRRAKGFMMILERELSNAWETRTWHIESQLRINSDIKQAKEELMKLEMI